MSSAAQWQCSCGFEGVSQEDLDEHIRIMASLAAEGEHHQVRTK